MPQVSYTQIIALRAEANSTLYVEDATVRYNFTCRDKLGTEVQAQLDKTDPLVPGFRANVLPLCNLPVDSDEVRFRTHDFSDKSDWDGRTHGDQVAYLAGGVMKHPVDGSWLNATGAGMIQAYGTPGGAHYGDPTYLFGAYTQRISAVYDDVNYMWISADGATRYAWLDLSVSPPAWKNDAGTVVVHYDTTAHDWVRVDTNAVVTSSLWRIKPYGGYKIQINEAWLEADNVATFTGTLHYLVYMNLDAGVAGPGYPAGNYQVRDWKYKTMADFQQGANTPPYVEPSTKTGHAGPIMTMGYDYSKTRPQVVDDTKGMHLDIVMDNHSPIINTLGAHGSFICLKIKSF